MIKLEPMTIKHTSVSVALEFSQALIPAVMRSRAKLRASKGSAKEKELWDRIINGIVTLTSGTSFSSRAISRHMLNTSRATAKSPDNKAPLIVDKYESEMCVCVCVYVLCVCVCM